MILSNFLLVTIGQSNGEDRLKTIALKSVNDRRLFVLNATSIKRGILGFDENAFEVGIRSRRR